MTPIDPTILAKFVEKFGKIPSMFGQRAEDVWVGEKSGFISGYQLCAAEKQVEIDALTARIATLERENAQLLAEADALESKLHDLEQQRQQDRDRLDHLEALRSQSIQRGYKWDTWRYFAEQSNLTIRQQLDAARLNAARAKEPHHD